MILLCKTLIILLTSTFCSCHPSVISKVDREILQKFWNYADTHGLQEKRMGERISLIARFFLDTPYKSNTLNTPGGEKLTINLHELDCVTFVDNVLALAFLSEYSSESEAEFQQNIQDIRYRKGIIEDFTSRLHYSSDWLYEMEERKLLKDVTAVSGGIEYAKEINFMSRHHDLYPPLKENRHFLSKIKEIEDSINKRTYYYIPKADLDKAYPKIKTGDIILITTGIAGMDTSHLGIAILYNGKIHLIHASSDHKKVMISPSPLKEYMMGIRSQTGIMIGRAALDVAQDLIEKKQCNLK